MNLLKKLYTKEIKPDIDYFFLTGTVLVFTLLRFPSLFEPDWYGDEAIYQVIGRAMLHGRLLYKGIWDNKPPLLYIYYALVDGDLFLIKLLSLLFGVGAIVVFYFIAKTLFQKSRFSVFLSTVCFAILFGLPFIEGNIANAENFMLFPTLLSLFILLRLTNKSKKILIISSGVLLSLSFLTKIVALFDFAAFLTILISIRLFNKDMEYLRKQVLRPVGLLSELKTEGIFAISFLAPIFLTICFFLVAGGFQDFLKAVFAQNVGYVNYGNKFIIPQGFLLIKLLILFSGICLVHIIKKKLGPSGLVVYVWLFFSLFSAFFSGRPYTHYVLVTLPAFSFLLGYVFHKGKLVIFHFTLFIIVLILIWFNFNFYKKIIPYYKNYYDYVFSKKSTDAYQSFFDGSTPRDYDIARFISMNTQPNENVFIVSNSAQIYYLSNKLPPGRYIVAYHLDFYNNAIEETQAAIQKEKPKYIISTDQSVMQNFLVGYQLKYNVQGSQIYERIY